MEGTDHPQSGAWVGLVPFVNAKLEVYICPHHHLRSPLWAVMRRRGKSAKTQFARCSPLARSRAQAGGDAFKKLPLTKHPSISFRDLQVASDVGETAGKRIVTSGRRATLRVLQKGIRPSVKLQSIQR